MKNRASYATYARPWEKVVFLFFFLRNYIALLSFSCLNVKLWFSIRQVFVTVYLECLVNVNRRGPKEWYLVLGKCTQNINNNVLPWRNSIDISVSDIVCACVSSQVCQFSNQIRSSSNNEGLSPVCIYHSSVYALHSCRHVHIAHVQLFNFY